MDRRPNMVNDKGIIVFGAQINIKMINKGMINGAFLMTSIDVWYIFIEDKKLTSNDDLCLFPENKIILIII